MSLRQDALHTGWGTKQGGRAKTWKRRYFMLCSDKRLYYYVDNSPDGKLKGTIDLNDVIQDVRYGGSTDAKMSWPSDAPISTRFEIDTPRRVFHIYCASAHAAEEWVDKLRALVGLPPRPKRYSMVSESVKQDQAIKEQLHLVAQRPENNTCADCQASGPTWSSWNIGVFLCMNCAGIHRSLGAHISKVKSISMDKWTPEQLETISNAGNAVVNQIYEAQLPVTFSRPTMADVPKLTAFIQEKYVQKKWKSADSDVGTISASAEDDGNDNTTLQHLHNEASYQLAEQDPMANHEW